MSTPKTNTDSLILYSLLKACIIKADKHDRIQIRISNALPELQ